MLECYAFGALLLATPSAVVAVHVMKRALHRAGMVAAWALWPITIPLALLACVGALFASAPAFLGWLYKLATVEAKALEKEP